MISRYHMQLIVSDPGVGQFALVSRHQSYRLSMCFPWLI